MTNHPLRNWRKAHGLAAAAFGLRLGVTKYAVCDYERLRRFPRPDTLSRIEAETGYAVTAADMLAAWQAGRSTTEPSP